MPQEISARLWQMWLRALDDGNQARVSELLQEIRGTVPRFPEEEQGFETTWQWLTAHPGSVGVSLHNGGTFSLAVIFRVDEDGQRRTSVIGLKLGSPPMPLDGFVEEMSGDLPGADARLDHEAMCEWLRKKAIEPILELLDETPSAVLWCPGPGLRTLAPSVLWPNLPVATTASLSLPSLKNAPGRRASTLIFLADPGPDTAGGRFDLYGHGQPAAVTLAEHAKLRKQPVRMLASVGNQYGRSLYESEEYVRDTVAGAEHLLTEARNHEIIVLIAHGIAETPGSAALLCVDESGAIERLDVARLQQEPQSFAGARVLLLSCESGRVGDSLVEPGGVAGTLIAAGARWVVAPLWTVELDIAEQIGKKVLRGLAKGLNPWEVLQEQLPMNSESSPTMGRRPMPLAERAERRVAEQFQRRAFVTWVG